MGRKEGPRGMSLVAVPGGQSPVIDGFEIGYVDEAGQQRRLPLHEVSDSEVALEVAAPSRSFPSYRGQRNNTGWWYFATTAKHVGFESWLERDHVMLLDFDQSVVDLSSQPFWLFWPAERRTRSHAPDFFARRADGTGVVIDCRPAGRVRPRDAEAFEATRRACDEAGWQYQLLHQPDPILTANVRWLAGYRHRRFHRPITADAALELLIEPMRVMDAAEALGDPLGTLPVLFHLLWSGKLATNLTVRLSEFSVLSLTDGTEAR